MAETPQSLPLYEIPYLRLFPWLRLFRCPGSAADPKRLMLAALGVVLLEVGWDGLGRAFVQGDRFELIVRAAPWYELGWARVVWRLAEPARVIVSPFVAVFDPSADARAFTLSALKALWALVVFGLIGGAIARVAAVDLTRSERVGLRESLRFAARKWVSLLGTPLVPMLGILMVATPLAAFGLLYRLPGWGGPFTAGLLAFLPLVGGLLLALILVGLALGWPLMHASVAVEPEDGFDAMSRAYAFVHQRPWHYGLYVAIAAAAGAAGLVFVDLFSELVVQLTAWALAFGGTPERVLEAYGWTLGMSPGSAPPSWPGLASAFGSGHQFWLSVVGLLALGWVYSYFWTAATAIYLLLRLDVDGVPWNTIAYQGRPSAITEALAESTPFPKNPVPPFPAPHTSGVLDADEVTGV